ncbi:hypothetical protein [Streptomyces lichenis]|uniref:Uncharacterized protein n=1 Tax=Streptomyces lichenis TaxID=2306967 RepID=A0ABT0IAZ9_9ACTN|nr:hypothetical protein [Streptomyces lichenis]MCK8678488.1 hypothetical protein [Streptomyces lichenis]
MDATSGRAGEFKREIEPVRADVSCHLGALGAGWLGSGARRASGAFLGVAMAARTCWRVPLGRGWW